MQVVVGGKKITLDHRKLIGEGGEALVYEFGRGTALKLYRQPEDPLFVGDAAARNAARIRLDEQQRKLKAFPVQLPEGVVVPQELVYDKREREVVGYTMRMVEDAEALSRFGEKQFRHRRIGNGEVTELFRSLHAVVKGLHLRQVTIGDFNDCNVLVRDNRPYVIDADSFQFAGFRCNMYTDRFVDPVLCDVTGDRLLLVQPHNPESDWYAFAVMLLRCLLYVDPYGGVYRPKDKRDAIVPSARPLKRITVFHPEVSYPKPAQPYAVLSCDLLQYLQEVFIADRRGEFPLSLLDTLRWTSCPCCGLEHCNNACPACQQPVPLPQRQVVRVFGQLTVTTHFSTKGMVLAAAQTSGRLHWLVQESGSLHREDGTEVLRGAVPAMLQFQLLPEATCLLLGSRVVEMRKDGSRRDYAVDCCGSQSLFRAAGARRFWVRDDVLWRDAPLGPERIGSVLGRRTLFWAGEQFGFGFYRAGGLQVGFVFDARAGGLHDQVNLPPIPGHILRAQCVFADSRCWLSLTTQEQGRRVYHLIAVERHGAVAGALRATEGEGSWLEQIGEMCAARDFLLAATDEGLIRVEAEHGAICKTREFPETEEVIAADVRLFCAAEGVYAVGERSIVLLQLR